MTGPVGVVFDTHNVVLAFLPAVGVDQPRPLLVTAPTTTHGDLTSVVSPGGFALGHRQLADGLALPQVLVDGLFVVGGPWLQVAVGVQFDDDVGGGEFPLALVQRVLLFQLGQAQIGSAGKTSKPPHQGQRQHSQRGPDETEHLVDGCGKRSVMKFFSASEAPR